MKTTFRSLATKVQEAETTSWYFGIVWVVANATVIALDLYMVGVLGVRSISSRIWDAQVGHPAITTLGVLLSVGVGYLVRRWGWMVFVTGVVCGHLFVHT